MKVLYYQCFAGISGDMNLGALLDLGVPEEYLISQLKLLGVKGYDIQITKQMHNSISGIKVDVVLSQKDLHHRHLSDIKRIISESSLNEWVKEKSIAIFEIIGKAEAKIHNVPLEKIHFHEVGAIDSIVDIVGAAICLDYLKPDKIYASPLELGGGLVTCAHGTFPVPAPATLEIVKNIPVTTGAVNMETTTPTGAAIIACFADKFMDKTNLVIEKTGYGIGSRELEIPNIVRVILGEEMATTLSEHALMLECNIDDMNPEYYDYIMARLFEAGAHDVFLSPIIMKKSRPANILHVLCDSTNQNTIQDILFKETTTIGLRIYNVEKQMLERQIREIKTAYGNVKIKEVFLNGKRLKYKAENSNCMEIARKSGLSLEEVYQMIEKELMKR